MGIIKKYQSGNKINYDFDSNSNSKLNKKTYDKGNLSFNNNDQSQQDLVKKKYDKYSNGTDYKQGVANADNYNFSGGNNNVALINKKYAPIENNFGKEQQSKLDASNSQASANNTASLISTGSTLIKNGGAQPGFNKSATVTAALTGVANAYAVSQDENATGQDRMNATSGAMTSTIGSINPAIGAAIAVGDIIGAGVKKDAEARNEDGTLKDVKKAKNSAYWGMILSPSKAFAFRQELDRQGDSSAWTTTDMNKYTDYLNKDALAAAEKTKKENEKLKLEKDKALSINRDVETYNNILKNSYKNGGKLIPKFRRGGPLDLEKENVILDGPSHSDTNRTGVKNDKGLPVVRKGVKVAEIESMELVLNKKSSDKIEKLANTYKKTKDEKVLQEIGTLMESEIKNNTYDYSKKLL